MSVGRGTWRLLPDVSRVWQRLDDRLDRVWQAVTGRAGGRRDSSVGRSARLGSLSTAPLRRLRLRGVGAWISVTPRGRESGAFAPPSALRRTPVARRAPLSSRRPSSALRWRGGAGSGAGGGHPPLSSPRARATP